MCFLPVKLSLNFWVAARVEDPVAKILSRG